MKDLYTNEEAKIINKRKEATKEYVTNRKVDVRKKIDDHLENVESCYYSELINE